MLSEFEEARRVLPGVAKRAATQLLETVRGCIQGDDLVDACREQAAALRKATLIDRLAGPPFKTSQKDYSLGCADVARSIYDPESLGLTYSVQGLTGAYWRHPQGTGDEKRAYALVRDRLQGHLDQLLAKRGRDIGDRNRVSLLAH